METLIVVAQHRNHYYGSKGKMNNPAWFGSSPTRGFREIKCRSFETGSGLLPSPFKSYGSPVLNRALSSPPKPQTPSGNYSRKSKDEDVKVSRKVPSSSPIPINLKDGGKRQKPSRGNDMSLSELWAGPAYSNSPLPSSLPIPKFSMKSKRTVSLELPVCESDLKLQPMAKSAPASPTREIACRSVDFLRNDDCATKTLRRILNLDIAED